MNKKSLLLGILFFMPFVSAQYFGSGFGTQGFIDSITRALEPLLIALFGGEGYTGYLLFEKLLLFILVSVFSYLALKNVPFFKDKNKHLARLIAIIVALLGIRNLDYLWFNTIFTQYKVLFVALAGIVPFIIYWFFLKDFDSLPRKVGWIFFAIVYFGLWITTDIPAHEEVYLIAALAALVYALFLDVPLVRWLELQQVKKGDRAKKAEMVARLREDIYDLQRQRNISGLTSYEKKELERIIKDKEKQIKKIRRY